MKAINITEKLSLFHDYWNPRIIGTLNRQQVRLVKVKGPFIWHHHEKEDELFFVLKGTLHMEFRDRTEVVKEGEMIIVPRGVEHRPVAPEEVHLMLFEPATTVNTGEERDERTRTHLESI